MADTPTDDRPLLVQRDGAVETLVINDPPRNRLGLALMDALEAEVARGVMATMGTPDQHEGIIAFLEKRKPVFNRKA
jgi:enoyl-CoA hydratase/carnithine racemase